MGPTKVRRIDEEAMYHICTHFQPLCAVILFEIEKGQELIITLISDFIFSVPSIAISAHSCLLVISTL